MKPFFAGLFGSLLCITLLAGGYFAVQTLWGNAAPDPFTSRRTPDVPADAAETVEAPAPATATVQPQQQEEVQEEASDGDAASPVSLPEKNGEAGLSRHKSSQVFMGDTGGVWYQIGGFTVEEIVRSYNVTTPGLYQKPHTRYAIVKANYHAVNYSEQDLYFYIEDSWITDEGGHIYGSSLSNQLREGAFYVGGEEKSGVLRYRVPIYDLPLLNHIYLLIPRVKSDPISGDISHSITFAE